MGQIYKLISSQPFPLRLYKIYFSWVKNKWIFLDLAIFKNPKIQGRHRHCLFVSCDDTWGAEQNYNFSMILEATFIKCLQHTSWSFHGNKYQLNLGLRAASDGTNTPDLCSISSISVMLSEPWWQKQSHVLKHCCILNITWLSAPDDFTETHNITCHTLSHQGHCTALYCAKAETIWQLKQF